MHENPPYYPAEHTWGVEVGLGLAARVSDFPTKSPASEEANIGWHLGLQYGPSRMWSFGLQYSMANAGVEKSLGTQSDKEFTIDRNLHSFLLELRVHPLPPVNRRVIRFFASLLAGATFEHVEATFTPAINPNSPSQPDYTRQKLSGNSDLAFALGGGLGADVELGGGLALIVRTTFTGHFLGDKHIVEAPFGPVIGGGTTTMFDARGGLQYRFDLGGGK